MRLLIATLCLPALLMFSNTGNAALIFTDHPQGATASAFYDSLTVETGSGTSFNNRAGLDTGEVFSQSFTLNSPITLGSIYLGYNDQRKAGDFTFAIDVGNNGSNDHTYGGIAVTGSNLQTGGSNSGPLHFMQFDVSSENIALAAGQHSFSVIGGNEIGTENTFLWAVIAHGSDIYPGGTTGGNLGSLPDVIFAVTAASPVPEPGALVLLGVGAVGIVCFLLQRRK